MTVFIAHAEADRAVAETLERYLERRGLFVELETGATGFRIAQASDAVVVLWSKEAMFATQRLLMERRTMEAWADEQLTFVKLDHAFAPIGLRDLPAVDATFDAQREIAWAAVARQIQDRHARQQAAPSPPPAPLPRAPAPERAKRGGGGAIALICGLLCLAAVIVGGLWSASRIGASYSLPEVSLDQFPALKRLLEADIAGVPVAALAAGAGGVFVLALLLAAAFGRRKAKAGAVAARSRGGAETPGGTVFVSYAHADDPKVKPIVASMKKDGRDVWLDQNSIGAGEGWAGEIVRAIRSAERVVVMCSARAFESDHVKREVYLADRYKRPLLPVFLESAQPPEDFEYFFAGVQWLELYKTPDGEQAAAVTRALAA